MKYKAAVNQESSYEVQIQSAAILLNNREITLDLAKINERRYHVIWQHRSFNAEILSADYQAKTFTLRINGKIMEVVLQDTMDLLIDKMGISAEEVTHNKEIRAPMPGLLLHIAVEEGQQVQAGTPLCTLEAMKMENVIKAPAQGTVSSLKIKEQQSVEKNQLLMIIE